MSKTLSVAAIQNGTVIDHIPAGQALKIIYLLRLLETNQCVTVGFKLPSNRMKHKDLIKIEDYVLTEEEANKITVFAQEATINVITNFNVEQKIIAHMPKMIEGVFMCPNTGCITHAEPVSSYFSIDEQGVAVKLKCRFCEKSFDRNQVKVAI